MLQRFKDLKESEQGFNLAEVVVVILIIAILVMMVSSEFTKRENKAFDNGATGALEKAERALIGCYDGKEQLLDFRKCSKPSNVTVVDVAKDGFTLEKHSKSGHVFTIVRYKTGKTVRICADPKEDAPIFCPKGWPK
ncbi:MAG: prepilin-type N-terminal cleavage/methylation domain-containing protein [Candidatus Saccharibacteria bacterium]|nr:prepilin-type N-terminal cleavage/methylation domain-containing protein [Candidatus Saccharibacteria bacterium]